MFYNNRPHVDLWHQQTLSNGEIIIEDDRAELVSTVASHVSEMQSLLDTSVCGKSTLFHLNFAESRHDYVVAFDASSDTLASQRLLEQVLGVIRNAFDCVRPERFKRSQVLAE